MWEAAMAAGHFGLDKLVCIVDRNRLQQGDRTELTMGLDPLPDKFRAFGWAVREVDGNDPAALLEIVRCPPLRDRASPTASSPTPPRARASPSSRTARSGTTASPPTRSTSRPWPSWKGAGHDHRGTREAVRLPRRLRRHAHRAGHGRRARGGRGQRLAGLDQGLQAGQGPARPGRQRGHRRAEHGRHRRRPGQRRQDPVRQRRQPLPHRLARWSRSRSMPPTRGANVKLVGVSSGVAYGELGPTHHSIEDIAWTRAIDRLVVIVPADPVETAQAIRAAYEYEGPVFIRTSRIGVPIVHAHGLPVPDRSSGRRLRDGDDVTLIANGVDGHPRPGGGRDPGARGHRGTRAQHGHRRTARPRGHRRGGARDRGHRHGRGSHRPRRARRRRRRGGRTGAARAHAHPGLPGLLPHRLAELPASSRPA